MITDKDCVQPGTYEYKGLSTDTKPTNCAVNSLFLELDTGDFYFFNGTEWGKINSTIQLGEDPTGTIQITSNGIFDVHNYAEADVDVPAITPTGTMSITENGTYDVANYAEASVDVDVTVNFNLPAFKKSTPTELSQARNNLAATTVGNYALFGGGDTGSHSDVVDVYDQTLTWSTPPHPLSQARGEPVATTVGNYALFGGGYAGSRSDVVDVYDQTLTWSTPPHPLSQARNYLAATTVAPAGGSSPQSGYALFGGGYASSQTNVVDAYDQTLTWSTPPHPLSQARNYLAATTVATAGGSSPQSGYALFGGGDYSSSKSNVVDAYDQTLTWSTPPHPLSQARGGAVATTVGNYALFGGGAASSRSDVVDAYDQTLTWSTPPHPLSQARNRLTAVTVGNYALFGGGWNGLSYFNVVDAYDQTLTLTTPAALSQARNNLAATTVAPAGDSSPQSGYALFGGGGNGNSVFSVVDAYSPYHDIQVFPGSKYSFNGNTEQTSSTWQTITMQGEVVGYMKVKDATIN